MSKCFIILWAIRDDWYSIEILIANRFIVKIQKETTERGQYFTITGKIRKIKKINWNTFVIEVEKFAVN